MREKRKIFNFIVQLFMYGIFILTPEICRAQEGKTLGVPGQENELGAIIKRVINLLVDFFVKYSFQALGGIIILVLGWLVARFVCRIFKDFLGKYKLDVTITKFLISTLRLIIMGLAGLIALGKFGIEIAPFIAGLSVIGFGTSFALQGPLSNYAAGATLIFTKPFKVGDIIEVAGVTGEVEDMTLPRTQLRTIDSTIIVVPNKHIIGEIIHNFSEFKKLDLRIGISYSADFNLAVEVIKNIIHEDNRITKAPEPKIGIEEFADSSVNLYARIWCKQKDYWDAMFDLNRKIFAEFNRLGIVIPFPQRDVHLYPTDRNNTNTV